MEKALFFLVPTLVLLLVLSLRHCTIYEYERGLLYSRGKFNRTLKPGSHWLLRPIHTVIRVDIRTHFVSIVGQEVLSADNISLKVSLAASYKISDPYQAINQTVNYQQALYLLLQIQIRDLIGSIPIDELLKKRKEIGQNLYAESVDQAADLGIELSWVNIKDIMFPGELKTIFAQVVNAKKEGVAALERARGESAALRNLANAAKLLENNPALMQMRLLQVLGAGSGNTVILTANLDEQIPLKPLQDKAPQDNS